MHLLRLFFLLFIVISHPCFGTINQKHDKQVWLRSTIKGHITDAFIVDAMQELRWGNNASRLYLQIAQIFLEYYINQHLKVGGGYRNTTRLGNTQTKDWYQAYSGVGLITFMHTMNEWKFSNRNWGQRESFPLKTIRGYWIYRNRTTIVSPFYMITPKMPFYIYDEVFFRERSGFFENRFGGGCYTKWTEHTTGYIELMYRRIKIADIWRPQTVFNFSFSFTF